MIMLYWLKKKKHAPGYTWFRLHWIYFYDTHFQQDTFYEINIIVIYESRRKYWDTRPQAQLKTTTAWLH